MACELARIARHSYLRQPMRARAELSDGNQDDLGKIFMTLRMRTGDDFSFYKRDNILRRIKRRMAAHRLDRIAHYVRYLQSQPEEVESLLDDLLISVTGFFREPEAFDALRHGFRALSRPLWLNPAPCSIPSPSTSAFATRERNAVIISSPSSRVLRWWASRSASWR